MIAPLLITDEYIMPCKKLMEDIKTQKLKSIQLRLKAYFDKLQKSTYLPSNFLKAFDLNLATITMELDSVGAGKNWHKISIALVMIDDLFRQHKYYLFPGINQLPHLLYETYKYTLKNSISKIPLSFFNHFKPIEFQEVVQQYLEDKQLFSCMIDFINSLSLVIPFNTKATALNNQEAPRLGLKI